MSEKGNAGQSTWNAGLYDESFSFIWEYGSGLIDLLNPQPGERILDLGCGTGHLTHAIRQRGANVIGIDHSATMIEQARNNYSDIRFEVADASNFSFDEAFDAVFSNAVLHWVRDSEGAVTSIGNALKSGGRLVAEFGGKGNVSKIIEATLDALREAGYSSREDRNPWFFPGIAEYAELLEQRGLETTSAVLFDRPTLLDGGSQGLELWLEMFGDSFFAGIPEPDRLRIVADIKERLRSVMFRDGNWYADYRRLRVVAFKPLRGSR